MRNSSRVLRALPDLHAATTLIAVLTLAILIAGNRWFAPMPGLRRVPAPLAGHARGHGRAGVWQFPGVATIGSAFGGIPRALPALTWPIVALVGSAAARRARRSPSPC